MTYKRHMLIRSICLLSLGLWSGISSTGNIPICSSTLYLSKAWPCSFKPGQAFGTDQQMKRGLDRSMLSKNGVRIMSEQPPDNQDAESKSISEETDDSGLSHVISFYTPHSSRWESDDRKSSVISHDSTEEMVSSPVNRLTAEGISMEISTYTIPDDMPTLVSLVQNGAYLNSRDDEDNSPLALAAQAGRTEAVKLMLDYGADIDAENIYGWTPLMLATYEGHTDIVSILVERDANLKLEDAYHPGKTALQIAKEEGHLDIVEILKKAGAEN
jgi:Ankyrin repeats (3 copies)